MFIEVILPVPLSDTYTYSVPAEMKNNISQGCLVLVEFGKNKHYSGIVAFIHQISPVSKFEIKPILAIESQSILRRPQLRFWEWIAQYYMCRQGEVYKAVLPSGFRTESSSKYTQKKETFVRLTSTYLNNEDNLVNAFNSLKKAPKQEKLLLAYLEYSQIFSNRAHKEISKKELLTKSQLNDTALNGLAEKGI